MLISFKIMRISKAPGCMSVIPATQEPKV
jgi:hypothetical protein